MRGISTGCNSSWYLWPVPLACFLVVYSPAAKPLCSLRLAPIMLRTAPPPRALADRGLLCFNLIVPARASKRAKPS